MAAKIAIIGAGQVGAAAAYALLHGSLYGELLLVDVKLDLREGQVRDLSDASFCENSSTRIRSGTYKEAGQCDIVVITAGSRRTIGETKIQSIERNSAVLRSIINAMKPFRKDTVLLIVSNPVDALTTLAQEVAGLPRTQVMGSGTSLDSVRLRRLLASKLDISSNHINAYVLGEHGDSQFVAWSCASIAGVPIDKAIAPETLNRVHLAEECKHEAQHIVKAKGSIAFGIGSIVAGICSSILFNKRDVRPVSHFQPDLGCCLSLPVVLGRKGIVHTVHLPLTTGEKAKLQESGDAVKEIVQDFTEEDKVSGMAAL